MTIVTFASGSSGNCALVSDGKTHLLLDAGISLRRIRAGLARQGLAPEKLAGILITHEHSDHISGLSMMVKYYGIPVLAPRTVANHLRWTVPGVDAYLREITPGEPFSAGNFRVTAFSTPHDTDQSVGYCFEEGVRFGFCTDTGCVTEEMEAALCGCDAAVLEANHDLAMLRYGPYPAVLKRRILSDRGHLSNDRCGEFACSLAAHGARTIILGHLSRENNLPSLARDTVRSALDAAGFSGVRLLVAPADGDLTLELLPCSV